MHVVCFTATTYNFKMKEPKFKKSWFPCIYLIVKCHSLQKLLQGDVSKCYNTRKGWDCMQFLPHLPQCSSFPSPLLSRLDLITLNISGLSTLHWWFILSILKIMKFLKGYRSATPESFCYYPVLAKQPLQSDSKQFYHFGEYTLPTLKPLKSKSNWKLQGIK